VVTAMLLAFISVFCLLVCALLFGFGGTAVGATLVVWVIGLVKLVLYMWPYAALFLMIAFVTRSSVSAAIFGFVYVIAEQLGTQLVLPAVFDGRLMWMSRLFPSYYIQRIGTNSDNIVVALAMCLGFAIITTAIGYGVFQKRDVK
jgi:L-cystine uptake protein TcyP (sodium:dicarboxylate symporter family)